jgi:Cu/Ag efflux pump CusA
MWSTTAKRATTLIGGGYLETPTQRIVIRAQAPGATLEALGQRRGRHARGTAGAPGRCRPVREGAEPRFGDALIAGKPGILIETSTQFGANTLEVTRALEERLDALAPALAKQGVEYHPALLRPASFIESAIEKLRNSLRLIGAVLVVALLLDHAARLARRAGFLQRHSARLADDGVDPQAFGLSSTP